MCVVDKRVLDGIDPADPEDRVRLRIRLAYANRNCRLDTMNETIAGLGGTPKRNRYEAIRELADLYLIAIR